MRDPYDVLGVGQTASAADIKSAYRRLARDSHPDRHPGDPTAADRFKDISAAYALLSDPDKRRRFDAGEIDAHGQETMRGRARGGARSPFEDIFRQHRARAGTGFGGGFGAGRGAGVSAPGANVTYTLKVTFADAARGTKRRVAMTNGKHFYVAVPAGTENGQVLRLKGQGMPGIGGGAPGDAHVEILVEADDIFRRDGLDILCDVPISLNEAVLGGKIEVPTIHGTVTMSIPAGANTGTKMRLKGRGIQPPKGEAGDQYVTLNVVLPEKPDAELTDFVRRWAPKHPYRVRRQTTEAQ